MPFTIPDNDLAFNQNQSIWMATDIAIMLASFNGDSVVSGCAVTAQGSPDMTLAVASGFFLSQNVQRTFAGGTATITTADATNPRTDLITISSSGVLTVTAGTAASLPRPPNLPSGHIALAMVYVPANDTAIQSNQITDKRVVSGGGLSGGGFVQTDLGYTTAGANWSTPTTGNTVVYLKKVTIPSDGVIGSVGGYVKGDGSHVGVIGSQVWSDAAGVPSKIIQFTPSAAATGNFYIGSGGQWIDFPCGLKVTAGQVVWLAIYIFNNAGSSSLGYDSANNHDRATTNIGGYWPSDLFSTSDNGVTWSIRGTLINNGGITGIRPTGAALLLDTAYTGSDISGASMTGGADYEVIANQTFVVNSPNSLVEIAVRTLSQSHKSAAGDSGLVGKIIIDSAGTPITKSIGGLISSNTEYRSVLSGSGSVFISGLAAGSHTVKVVLRPDATCDLYLRPNTTTEFMTLQVVEHVSAGLVVSGSAFPTNPFTGQQFFRTDRGIGYFYDGTNWLSVDIFEIDFNMLDAAVNTGLNAGSINAGRARVPWRGTYSLYILNFEVTVTLPAGTNNGSNYSTFKLNYGDAADSDTQVGSTLNTSALSPSTVTNLSTAVNATLSANARWFKCRKDNGAGTPGNGIFVVSGISYRLIG